MILFHNIIELDDKEMFKLIVIQSILTLCLSSSSPNGWPGNGNWPDGGGGWPDGGGGDYWPGNGDSSQLKCGTNIPGVINITSDGSRNCSEGEIPWQVSVQKKSNGIWKHACGGVVINKQFVLTSAKCVDG